MPHHNGYYSKTVTDSSDSSNYTITVTTPDIDKGIIVDAAEAAEVLRYMVYDDASAEEVYDRYGEARLRDLILRLETYGETNATRSPRKYKMAGGWNVSE